MTQTFLSILLITGVLIYLFLDLINNNRIEKRRELSEEALDTKNKLHEINLEKLREANTKPSVDVSKYRDLMTDLDTMIATQVYFMIELKVSFQSTKILVVEKFVPDVTKLVITGMGRGFANELEKFHSVDFVRRYIENKVMIYAIEWIHKNKNNM